MHVTSFVVGFTTCLLLLVGVKCLGVLGPWARALTSRAPISMMTIIGMKLRGTNTRIFVDAYIRLTHRGKKPSTLEVEKAYIRHKDRIHTAEDLIDYVVDETD